jgi:hypothetical protein
VEKELKIVRELWAGEVPLKPAFWIYAFAVELGFKWVMRWAGKYGYSEGPVYLALSALAIAYSVFAGVAVWRSASRFEGGKGWAAAARIAAILWPLTIFWGP